VSNLNLLIPQFQWTGWLLVGVFPQELNLSVEDTKSERFAVFCWRVEKDKREMFGGKPEVIDPSKLRSHAFVAMSPASQNLRAKLPRLNIHPHHPHLVNLPLLFS
jgi:hypothetical protein